MRIDSFSVVAKMLAIATGIHPRRPRLERWFAAAPLELGLVVGALLIVLGLAATLLAVSQWAATQFGNLDPIELTVDADSESAPVSVVRGGHEPLVLPEGVTLGRIGHEVQ